MRIISSVFLKYFFIFSVFWFTSYKCPYLLGKNENDSENDKKLVIHLLSCLRPVIMRVYLMLKSENAW